MDEGIIFHCGMRRNFEYPLVKRLASDYGLDLRLAWPGRIHADFLCVVDWAKRARMMTIWNGMLCHTPLFTSVCKEKRIPRIYMEMGMLPQRFNVFVDPLGFAGSSILNTDVSWVCDEDMRYLSCKRKELQGLYGIEDGDYVLVPLQKENDSQILYYTKYLDMHEFVRDVIDMYPGRRIVVKPHPLELDQPFEDKVSFEKVWSGDNRIEIADSKKDFLSLAAKASVVVGMTSTTLYESAILGKEVVSLGKHPLSSGQDREKVLAGALFLNVDGMTGSLKKVMDRFDIRPLGF